TSYLMRQRQELELKKRVVGLLDLNSDWTETEVKEAEGFIGSVENSEKEDLFKRAEEKLASICSERVRLEDLLRKANSDYHGDGKFVELQEKYVQVFKDPISFDVGMNSVDGDDGDDDDGDGNGDDEDGGCKSIEKQVDATTKEVDATTKEVDATTKENVVEESDEITCTPESFSQWIDANSDFVLEQIDCVVDEYLYGDALDAVAEDIETVFETTSSEEKVLGIRLNMETLSLGLCINANVVDCWAKILNYEDYFRKDGSLSRHFFLTGCITKSMFDGTLSTYEEKWKSFAAEVSAQFKDNVGGLALSGIDLVK
ncbi:hypothetical protein Tco_0299028, partial [Tanacetum coccineum]